MNETKNVSVSNRFREQQVMNTTGDSDVRLMPAAGELLQMLSREPGVGVAVIALDGTILYINEQSVRMLRGDQDDELVGLNMRDLFDERFVAERLEIFARVVETSDPVVLRHIRRGVQIQSTIWPVSDEDDAPRVLIVTREGITDDTSEDHFEIIESKYVDLGPLDVLTTRELEVLSLIGQGLSLAAIGAALHRSPKTIEKHRDAIARKLKIRNRIELAKLAANAGLELIDAQRERLSR